MEPRTRFGDLGQARIRARPQVQEAAVLFAGAGGIAAPLVQARELEHIARLENRDPLACCRSVTAPVADISSVAGRFDRPSGRSPQVRRSGGGRVSIAPMSPGQPTRSNRSVAIA